MGGALAKHTALAARKVSRSFKAGQQVLDSPVDACKNYPVHETDVGMAAWMHVIVQHMRAFVRRQV